MILILTHSIAAFLGFMLAALMQMARDPHPEHDESHAATRYEQMEDKHELP